MKVETMVSGLIVGVIGVILLFHLVAGTATPVRGAAANVAASGLPLATLFGTNGVMLIAYIAMVIIGAIGLIFGAIKVKGK